MDVQYSLISDVNFLSLEDTGSYIQKIRIDGNLVDFEESSSKVVTGFVKATSSYDVNSQERNFRVLLFKC